MFRRSNSRDPNLSAYMADRFGRVDEEDEEEEEEEDPLTNSQDYRRPQLDPISEGNAQSQKCLCCGLNFLVLFIIYILWTRLICQVYLLPIKMIIF